MTSMTVSAARPLSGAMVVRSGVLAALGVALLLVVTGPWRPAEGGGDRERRAAAERGLADMPPAAQGPISGSARPR